MSTPSPRPLSRRLASFLLWFILLAGLLSCAVLWIRRQASNQVRERMAILKALEAKAPGQPAPAASPAVPASAASPATLVEDLPFLGRGYSTDPASQAAWNADKELVRKFTKALGVGEDGDLLDFNKVLLALGLSPPTDGSQVAAAAMFLKAAQPILELLAKADAEAAQPWDWSQLADWRRQEPGQPGYIELLSEIMRYGKLHGYLARARMTSGDHAGAEADLQAIAKLARPAASVSSIMGSLVHQVMRSVVTTERRRITLQGGWTDEQLARIAAPDPGPNPLLILKRGLEHEAAGIEDRASDMGAFRQVMEGYARAADRPTFPLAELLTSDAMVRDRLEFSAALSRVVGSQVTPEGAYQPHPPGWEAGLEPDKGLVAQILASTMGAQGQDMPSAAVYGRILLTGVAHQEQEDLVRLQAALELHRRQQGNYPADVQGLQPWFPQGMPLDPATGQPYHFSSGPGELRLWSEGHKLENKDGKSKEDLTIAIPLVAAPQK